MPAETHLQVLGAAATRQADLRRLLVWTALILALILLVLQAAVASWRRAALLVLVIPLGTVGGVLTAPLGGGVATAGGIAGVFAVGALTVRTGLVLVRRIRELERVRGVTPGRSAAAQAARERAVPVLRSALAIAAVMLPVLLLGDRAGLEVLRPLAFTVLGGLVTSVIVTLAVLPGVCGLTPPPKPPDEPRTRADEPAVSPMNLSVTDSASV
jgi:Cu/Ag efflux pump CusA